MERKSRTPAIALAATVLLALLLRVVPSFPLVFTAGFVNFQEGDAWFHVRTVHNLLAHFPRRSGFDPYALFPGGQNIPTAPVWDYLLATTAWILGFGSPSPALTDAVAAWMPAILGALFPIPVFVLARRLFGETAGFFAALWMAAGSGALLWVTHLGLADHHAAEGLFALLVLLFLFLALDRSERRFAWMAGIALGLFLATRPAGIFVPGILAVTIVLEPAAASMVLPAIVAAAAVFLPASGVQWSDYAWMALGATGALAAGTLALQTLARTKAWPRQIADWAPTAVLLAGCAGALLLKPHLVGSLWFEIRRMTGHASGSNLVKTVQELQPVYRAGSKPGWTSVFQLLGAAWAVALPAFGWLVTAPFKRGQPARRLLLVWTVVVAAAGVMQVRMAIYLIPVAALLAGGTCAWIVARTKGNGRRLALAAVAAAVVAVNLPWGLAGMRHDGGISEEWRQAFLWLREHSPEPVSGSAWNAYYPRIPDGSTPPAAGRWGVAVWWDFAYPLEQIAHRVPMSNGTQSGEEEMARFYTDSIPESAVGWLRRVGARYVVVDSAATLFPAAMRFPAQLRLLGRKVDAYEQILIERAGADGKVVRVYQPTYYQTMAARLFLAEGQAVDGTGPWVFETTPGHGPGDRPIELIAEKHHFESEAAAARYLGEHPFARLTYGCLDDKVSCVAVPAVAGLRKVFTSQGGAVKIFEVL